MRDARLPRERLAGLQDMRLRRIVRHAYDAVPHYRKLFDAAGLSPGDVRTMEDLPKIPVTRKEDLLNLPTEQRAARGANVEACVVHMTSGSTGMPFRTCFSVQEKTFGILSDLRALLRNGLRFTDRTLMAIDPRDAHIRRFWFQRMGILRREYLDILADRGTNLNRILAGGFEVLRGLTSELVLTASEILDRGLQGPRPRIVTTGAELLDPTKRRLIRQAFQTDPTDLYGAMECGYIAWQCPERSGYHVNADLMAVEIIRNGLPCRPGEEGEVVVTPFLARTMPLLRYSLGDLAVVSDKRCPCGCALPMIEGIRGRTVDCIQAPSGEWISPYRFTCAVEEVYGVKAYQITQETRGEIRVDYETGVDDERIPIQIRAKIKAVVGDAVAVHARRVEKIPREKGKFQVVRNRCAHVRTT
jgi:phenylacetate-CoA ligase